ncbi:hypothetical protein TNCV_2361211 [Trichonephila clavipes]|nr:hypothetical protein TNCV_2361211 [Trichonephila clavipes]
MYSRESRERQLHSRDFSDIPGNGKPLENRNPIMNGGQMHHASLQIICGTEDDYLFMEESNSDGENDTEFNDVPEDITEDEYADLFMSSNSVSS